MRCRWPNPTTAAAGPYAGTPQAHYGRIAIRDPRSLRMLDWIPCHGIDPHELRLSADGRQVLAANYGSVAGEGSDRLGAPRRVVEACVTVTDLASGALVERIVATDPETELRHLAQAEAGQVFGIRCRLGPPGADAELQRALGEAGRDLTADAEGGYLPAAPVLVADGRAAALARGTAQDRLRHGLSVEYEPEHGEFLATFPSSHRLIAFDARTGRIRWSIDTRELGLRYPSGLALLAGGTYAVAGCWQDVAVLRRGSHRIEQRLGSEVVWYGHSQMTVA